MSIIHFSFLSEKITLFFQCYFNTIDFLFFEKIIYYKPVEILSLVLKENFSDIAKKEFWKTIIFYGLKFYPSSKANITKMRGTMVNFISNYYR
jgi:hypothetical protein